MVDIYTILMTCVSFTHAAVHICHELSIFSLLPIDIILLETLVLLWHDIETSCHKNANQLNKDIALHYIKL